MSKGSDDDKKEIKLRQLTEYEKNVFSKWLFNCEYAYLDVDEKNRLEIVINELVNEY